MERAQRKVGVEGSSHFLAASQDLSFIRTGCTLLDSVVGGGWPLGRIANIVGDKSTGKTLLAIEAAANFARDYPRGRIWYREAEAAFDKSYAAALGMPIDRVKFGRKLHTVEDFFEDLSAQAEWCKRTGRLGLYILDSLDSLSDRKEMEREIDKSTYGGDKAKQMSQLFRKLTRSIEEARMNVIIISQVRDKIGISFGRKTTRSGGKALDFYASIVLYLAHIKTISRVRKGQKRAVAVRIRAKCDKNKISLPFRECDFTIRFGYGIEDLQANVAWLKEVKALPDAGLSLKEAKAILEDVDSIPEDEYAGLQKNTARAVKQNWRKIEGYFLPKRKKY